MHVPNKVPFGSLERGTLVRFKYIVNEHVGLITGNSEGTVNLVSLINGETWSNGKKGEGIDVTPFAPGETVTLEAQ